MATKTIEDARQILNDWEHRAANDKDNQKYVQTWADARGLTFVDVYTYLINERKAAMLEAWGFSANESWEIQATQTHSHQLIHFEGPPVEVWELPFYAFLPEHFA